MLSDIQRNEFTLKAKEVIKQLLNELGISELTDNNIGILQNELVSRVSGLVSAKEERDIDTELLKLYDLLTDIIWDNEEDLNFLNNLFFN